MCSPSVGRHVNIGPTQATAETGKIYYDEYVGSDGVR